MIPSPHAVPPSTTMARQDTLEPSIIIHINVGTSWHALQAVREAVYELREVYGIYVTYEIANDAIIGAGPLLDSNGLVILEVLGHVLEIDDYDYLFDEEAYIKSIKDTIIYEVLKIIGSPVRNEWVASPRSITERPSYPEAVLAAE